MPPPAAPAAADWQSKNDRRHQEPRTAVRCCFDMSNAFNSVPANRNASGKFIKGASGNPTGRPKSQTGVLALARSNSIEAIERLVTLMRTAESEQVQLNAANAILDRAYGKPKESKDVEINVTRRAREVALSDLSDAQIEALQAYCDALPQVIEGEAMEVEE